MSTGKNNNYFHWWYIVVCILQRDLYILDVGLLSSSFLSIFQTEYVFIFYICAKRSFPHSRLITGFVTRLAPRVPLVEQELLTLPEHLGSTRFLVGFVLPDLQFYMYVLQIVVYPFVLFPLAIVLSVLLRYTDSDYLPLVSSNSFLTFIRWNLLERKNNRDI